MVSTTDHVAYEFGPFRLLPRQQILLREGKPVRLGFKAIDILTILVARQGELVSKEDLAREVWPNSLVHESNVKVNITALRKTLGEQGPFGHYIVNVPRRGYRFIAPVRVISDVDGAPTMAPAVLPQTLPKYPAVIGRSNVIGELSERLAEVRCVTVVGPGGVGKTTVAVALAHAVAERFQDGVCFTDFSTLGDPQYVVAAIASTLGVRSSARDLLAEIVDALRARRILLIFDNCEHLSTTLARVIEQIITNCPGCRIVATSREPLRADGETVYRLSTLDLPADPNGLSASAAMHYPAIRLFVVTASECSGFVLEDGDVPSVASICRRLDGLPLAIKLAAAATVSFGPAQLLSMLEERFAVLNYGPRDAPLRQQTLLATLDWSYQLLSEDEAGLFRKLSVFAGFFGLQDAVAMARTVDVPPHQVVDTLGQLVSKSLVTADYHDGEMRYRLLESTRAYASRRLAMANEERSTFERYAGEILATFNRAEEEWSWRGKREWLAAYAGKLDDLRKAQAWAFGALGDAMLGVELTAAAIPLWDELSSITESRSGINRALKAAHDLPECPPDLKMKLATAHAWSMNYAHNLIPETEAAWADSIRYAQEACSAEYQMRGLWGLAVYLIYTGRHDEAIIQLERFESIAKQSDPSALSDGERLLATAEMYIGRVSLATERLERLAAQNDTLVERSRTARFQLDRYVAIRCSLCFLLWLTGHPMRAADVAREAVQGAQRIGHIVSQSNAIALGALPVTFWLGDLESAAAFQEMLDANNRRENIEIWGPVSRFFKGAIEDARGEAVGVKIMQDGLADLTAGRFFMRIPMFHSMLAEALLAKGNIAGASRSVLHALTAAQGQHENWCLAEVLRVQGELYHRQGARDEAESVFLGAIETARDIGALTFELRAAMSLFGLWRGVPRETEGRHILAETLRKFPEGTGSADIVRARRLLGSSAFPGPGLTR